MLSLRPLWILVTLLFVVPAFAQQASSSAPTAQITGTVQSLSGDILDVKPATTPAVWVTIPPDLHVDRSALKEGISVSVQAHWVDICYVATDVTIQK